MGLPRGVPAILLLASTLLVGAGLGQLVAARPGGRAADAHAVLMGVTAAFFWAWAVKHSIDAGTIGDAGAISFLLPISAAATGLISPAACMPSNRQARFAATACAVVALNYFLPAPFAFAYRHWWLGVYYALGGAVWTLFGLASMARWGRPAAGLAQTWQAQSEAD